MFRVFGKSVFRRRLASVSTSARPNGTKTVGFAFDIDGVLLHGKKPIAGASTALNILQQQKIPFILLTNGGGKSEKERAEVVSDLLDVDISPFQLIQSHTPYKTLVDKHSKILIIGPTHARAVAESYGFKEVVHPIDIIRYNPLSCPFTNYSEERILKESKVHPDLTKTKFDAILVFTDPADMSSDLQITMDLLNSDGGQLETSRSPGSPDSRGPSIPIYFSCNDLLWSNGYPLNRFGLGSYRIIVERMYAELNPQYPQLKFTMLGKPTETAYMYAHHTLVSWTKNPNNPPPTPELNTRPANDPFDSIYMVGDNPHSDIIGAYNYNWESCLVRTGVYRDGDPLPCKPTLISDNVLEAVNAVLQQ